ncbi:MAG: ABC transporter permease, partial [Gammaproteobacteria bacterium]
MNTNKRPAGIRIVEETGTLHCGGYWDVASVASLESQLDTIFPRGQSVVIDGSSISAMDSIGAWVLQKLIGKLYAQDKIIRLQGFSPAHDSLISMVAAEVDHIKLAPPPPKTPNWFYRVGLEGHHKLRQGDGLLILIGQVLLSFLGILRRPKRFQLGRTMAIIEQTGYQALPILALLLSLIGVVLVYQMGIQLKTYGGETYVVYLSGAAILREFGPLITAIIIAGRTSSSFTAQIGLMKVNEEIDALSTMGISPIERIVMPRIIGLLISLPLITFWANMFGVIGSMMMTKSMF